MAKVNPASLNNGDIVKIGSKKCMVLYVKPEPNNRTRIYTYTHGSFSVPSDKKVTKEP